MVNCSANELLWLTNCGMKADRNISVLGLLLEMRKASRKMPSFDTEIIGAGVLLLIVSVDFRVL